MESLTSFVGVDGTNPALNSARLQINLKPLDERDDRVQTVISRLQQAVDGVPGVALYLQPTQDLTIDTTVSRTQYQFTLQANSLEALSTWVPPLLSRLQAQPQLADVSSDWQDKGLAAYIKVDRDSASRLGISMADVDNALYNAFGQRLISTIYTQANHYRVVLEQDTEATPGLAALENIRLTSSDGGIVPLTAIATVEQRFTPLSVNHLDQFPVTTISFNVPDNYSLGEAVEAILAAEQSLDFPTDIRTQFQGSSLAFQSALGSTVWLVVAAVVAMYIVLGVLYESFIHPITILSTLPTAGVGALLALWLAGSELDVIAIIGIILLIGIVKKNAIMMIDFALAAEREQGMPPREAIYRGLSAAFSADPDDHPRRPARRPAADAEHRRRRRAAASAGDRHGRRSDAQPGADPVHHPGDLSAVRPPVAAPEAPLPASGRGGVSEVFALFIYRPVATILISLAITLCGILGFRLLPVAPLPQVDFR